MSRPLSPPPSIFGGSPITPPPAYSATPFQWPPLPGMVTQLSNPGTRSVPNAIAIVAATPGAPPLLQYVDPVTQEMRVFHANAAPVLNDILTGPPRRRRRRRGPQLQIHQPTEGLDEDEEKSDEEESSSQRSRRQERRERSRPAGSRPQGSQPQQAVGTRAGEEARQARQERRRGIAISASFPGQDEDEDDKSPVESTEKYFRASSRFSSGSSASSKRAPSQSSQRTARTSREDRSREDRTRDDASEISNFIVRRESSSSRCESRNERIDRRERRRREGLERVQAWDQLSTPSIPSTVSTESLASFVTTNSSTTSNRVPSIRTNDLRPHVPTIRTQPQRLVTPRGTAHHARTHSEQLTTPVSASTFGNHQVFAHPSLPNARVIARSASHADLRRSGPAGRRPPSPLDTPPSSSSFSSSSSNPPQTPVWTQAPFKTHPHSRAEVKSESVEDFDLEIRGMPLQTRALPGWRRRLNGCIDIIDTKWKGVPVQL